MITAGFDEAGRGAWAGPLVVAAVALSDEADYSFRDSKRYSRLAREQALLKVYGAATSISICVVPATAVDKNGLGAALGYGFMTAANNLQTETVDSYIVDGSIDYLQLNNSKAEPNADDTYQSVAAASIVAKVHRDKFMARAAAVHPGFSFDQHVGYGTAAHRSQLSVHGPSSLHRISFKPVKAY